MLRLLIIAVALAAGLGGLPAARARVGLSAAQLDRLKQGLIARVQGQQGVQLLKGIELHCRELFLTDEAFAACGRGAAGLLAAGAADACCSGNAVQRRWQSAGTGPPWLSLASMFLPFPLL